MTAHSCKHPGNCTIHDASGADTGVRIFCREKSERRESLSSKSSGDRGVSLIHVDTTDTEDSPSDYSSNSSTPPNTPTKVRKTFVEATKATKEDDGWNEVHSEHSHLDDGGNFHHIPNTEQVDSREKLFVNLSEKEYLLKEGFFIKCIKSIVYYLLFGWSFGQDYPWEKTQKLDLPNFERLEGLDLVKGPDTVLDVLVKQYQSISNANACFSEKDLALKKCKEKAIKEIEHYKSRGAEDCEDAINTINRYLLPQDQQIVKFEKLSLVKDSSLEKIKRKVDAFKTIRDFFVKNYNRLPPDRIQRLEQVINSHLDNLIQSLLERGYHPLNGSLDMFSTIDQLNILESKEIIRIIGGILDSQYSKTLNDQHKRGLLIILKQHQNFIRIPEALKSIKKEIFQKNIYYKRTFCGDVDNEHEVLNRTKSELYSFIFQEIAACSFYDWNNPNISDKYKKEFIKKFIETYFENDDQINPDNYFETDIFFEERLITHEIVWEWNKPEIDNKFLNQNLIFYN